VSRALPEETLIRIKAATRDLVRLCGGLARAGELLGVSEQTVSRYQLPTHPEVIPLSAVLILEADAGLAPVTRAMAQANGRDLAEGDGAGAAAGCLMQRHSAVIREAGEVMSHAADAFADGRVSPTEAERLDRQVGELEAAVGRMRTDLAKVKAGEKVHVFKGKS